jgi:hypothetical protein
MLRRHSGAQLITLLNCLRLSFFKLVMEQLYLKLKAYFHILEHFQS